MKNKEEEQKKKKMALRIPGTLEGYDTDPNLGKQLTAKDDWFPEILNKKRARRRIALASGTTRRKRRLLSMRGGSTHGITVPRHPSFATHEKASAKKGEEKTKCILRRTEYSQKKKRTDKNSFDTSKGFGVPRRANPPNTATTGIRPARGDIRGNRRSNERESAAKDDLSTATLWSSKSGAVRKLSFPHALEGRRQKNAPDCTAKTVVIGRDVAVAHPSEPGKRGVLWTPSQGAK